MGTTRAKDKTDEMFANSEPDEGFSHLPGGKHEVVFVDAEKTRIAIKEGGGKVAFIKVQVDDPSSEHNEKFDMFKQDLTSQIGINIFAGMMKKMEFEPPKSTQEAAKCLSQLVGMRGLIWTDGGKDEFPPKMRINERLNGEVAERGSEEDPVASEPEPTAEPAAPDFDNMTWAEVGVMAEDENEVAQNYLVEQAKEADIDPDNFSWPELAEQFGD